MFIRKQSNWKYKYKWVLNYNNDWNNIDPSQWPDSIISKYHQFINPSPSIHESFCKTSSIKNMSRINYGVWLEQGLKEYPSSTE